MKKGFQFSSHPVSAYLVYTGEAPISIVGVCRYSKVAQALAKEKNAKIYFMDSANSMSGLNRKYRTKQIAPFGHTFVLYEYENPSEIEYAITYVYKKEAFNRIYSLENSIKSMNKMQNMNYDIELMESDDGNTASLYVDGKIYASVHKSKVYARKQYESYGAETFGADEISCGHEECNEMGMDDWLSDREIVFKYFTQWRNNDNRSFKEAYFTDSPVKALNALSLKDMNDIANEQRENVGCYRWNWEAETFEADFIECKDESCDTGHCPTCGNCWDGIEVSCSKCGDDWGEYSKLLDRELYGAETFEAKGGEKMNFYEKLNHLVNYYGVGGLYLKRNYKKGQKLEEMLDDLGIPRGMVKERRIINEAIHQNKYKYLGVSDWNATEKVVKAYINELRKKGDIYGADETPICECGIYLTGNPRYIEQECLDCGKKSHQKCGDDRKWYVNCAFCKSGNVQTTNLEEWRKLNGYGAETFNVEFDDWAKQEMLTHGEDISFKEWAKDESEKHGDMDLEDWAEHEEESHDERYGAERYWDKDTDSYREIYKHSIEVREFPKSSSVYQNGKLVKQYKGQGHFTNATAYAQKLENDYVPKSFFAEGDGENMTSKLKSPYVIGAFAIGLGIPYITSFLNSKKDK